MQGKGVTCPKARARGLHWWEERGQLRWQQDKHENSRASILSLLERRGDVGGDTALDQNLHFNRLSE